MLTVLAILAVLALILAIIAGAGKCPLWVPVVLLAMIECARHIPMGR